MEELFYSFCRLVHALSQLFCLRVTDIDDLPDGIHWEPPVGFGCSDRISLPVSECRQESNQSSAAQKPPGLSVWWHCWGINTFCLTGGSLVKLAFFSLKIGSENHVLNQRTALDQSDNKSPFRKFHSSPGLYPCSKCLCIR